MTLQSLLLRPTIKNADTIISANIIKMFNEKIQAEKVSETNFFSIYSTYVLKLLPLLAHLECLYSILRAMNQMHLYEVESCKQRLNSMHD
jgi:hypothetical protein